MKIKTKLMGIISTLVMIASAMGMVGCKEKFIESGDFLYSLSGNKLYLEGLSEQGKQKETIIIPYQIDGYKVDHYTYHHGFGSRGNFKSETLKQLYILPNVSIVAININFTPNLKKIVFIGTNNKTDFAISNPYGMYDVKMYTSSVKNYSGFQVDVRGIIVGFDHAEKGYLRLTNCNFISNYEEADNEGYYWVDYFNYGDKIEYIPENPVRDGYIFGGWYKEAECENKWDFDKDTLPEAIFDEEEEELYQETRLYAKWYKN